MKASIKFREDQKPLCRAKVPLSVLNFPFQSGIIGGESKELALSLATFFDSGPSLKIYYRPNDSINPFSLVFKTGIGHFGSPISSPMTMSAEFNLTGSQNPAFFVHFKPRFGDFCLKKSQSSEFVKSTKPKSNGALLSDDEGSVEVVDTPLVVNAEYSPANKETPVIRVLDGSFSSEKFAALRQESTAASLIGGLLSGAEASARTVLPVTNRAAVSFRWGLRFPNPKAGISFQKFPLLVMDKIKVEHMVGNHSKSSHETNPQGNENVAEACLAVKRQLELIQSENGMLRKAMDDLRSEFSAGKSSFSSAGGRVVDRWSNGDKKPSDLNGFGGKGSDVDATEELKKALKGV
ncbi:hypothetical protein NMG60_11003761 [Bertholletia excelsa]